MTKEQTQELDLEKVAELALHVALAVRNILEKEDRNVGFYALVSAISMLVSYDSMQTFLSELAVSADAREKISRESLDA